MSEGWTLVKKNKKQTIRKKNTIKKVSYKNKFVLPNKFYEPLDGLSVLVCYVLSGCDHPLPASAIKNAVNGLIKNKEYPILLTDEKKEDLQGEYIKKDIGWTLYDGPLSKWLSCDNSQIPRLWKLDFSFIRYTFPQSF